MIYGMKKYILSLVLVLIYVSTFSQAIYITTGVNGNWNNTLTWDDSIGTPDGDGDGIPDSNDDVYVLHTTTVNVTANVLNLHVADLSGALVKGGFGFGNRQINIGGFLAGDDGAGGLAIPTNNIFADLLIQLNFTGSGNIIQSWSTASPIQNLTINSSGAFTIASDIAIGAGSFTITGGTQVNFNGDIENNGTFSVAIPAVFNKGSSQILGGSGTGFNFSNTVTFNNTMDFNTSVVFDGTTNAGSNNVSFGNDFTNNGSFTGSGIITFDGTSAQSIEGSSLTTFQNLTISNTTAPVTVNGTGSSIRNTLTFDPSTTFNANGKVTLVSTGTASSSTARIAEIPSTASVSGNFIYQRRIVGAQQWHGVGLPISGTTSIISASGYPDPDNSLQGDFKRYDEAVMGDFNEGLVSSKTAPFSAISDTRGYFLWTRTADDNKTLQVTGPLNTGTVPLTVSYTDDTGQPLSEDGWNLVNNPYASQVEWSSGGWTKTRLDGSAYVWNPTAGNYTVINGSGTIASGQAFWVKANGTGTPALTARQSVKSSSSATFSRSEGVDDELYVYMRFNGGEYEDLTRVRFLSDAIEEFDSKYDGYKLSNDIFNLSSMTNEGMDLSINTLPTLSESRSVKLNMTNIWPGAYTLDFEEVSSFSDAEITLIDHFLDKEEVLREGLSYQFSITTDENSFGKDRFELRFGEQKVITSTIQDDLGKSNIKLFPNPVGDESLNIELLELANYNTVMMYNSQGKMVFEENIDTDIEIDMSRFNKGVYFIHLVGDQGSSIHKILKN